MDGSSSHPPHHGRRAALWTVLLAALIAVPLGCGGVEKLGSVHTAKTVSYVPGIPNFDLEAIGERGAQDSRVRLHLGIPPASLVFLRDSARFRATYELSAALYEPESKQLVTDRIKLRQSVEAADFEAALGPAVLFDPLYKYAPVYGYTIIANDEFMENNMEYTTRVLEGYSHAMKWTMLNIEDALRILRQEVNPSLQVQELETQANALRISIIATAATEGYRENGAAYLNEEVVDQTLSVYGQVVEGGEVPDLTDAANFEPQENADLAQFSSDEWSQIEEQAGDFVSYFE
jgi:hypothetical protein